MKLGSRKFDNSNVLGNIFFQVGIAISLSINNHLEIRCYENINRSDLTSVVRGIRQNIGRKVHNLVGPGISNLPYGQ